MSTSVPTKRLDQIETNLRGSAHPDVPDLINIVRELRRARIKLATLPIEMTTGFSRPKRARFHRRHPEAS